MNRKLLLRLSPLYIAAFFQAFNLWYAIEKLFMSGIGFDDAAIALAVALFTIVTLLVETPSGILADRWSRKGVLIIASLAMIICSVIAGLSDSVPMYMIALLFIGVYYAMYSGTYEAVVYDVLIDETKSGQGFEKYYGRLQIFSSIALVGGSLVSGIVSQMYGLQVVYFLTVPFMILSIIALLLFKEPSLHKARVAVRFNKQLLDTFKTVSQAGPVRWLVAGLIIATLTTSLIFEFNQLWYIALTLPIVLFGVTNALVQACLGIGGFIAGIARQSRFVIACIAIVMVISSSLLTMQVSGVVIVGQVILQSLLVAVTIIIARRLHDAIPSNNRAGIVSAISTMSKLAFVPVALIFGLISREQSVFSSAWLVVALVILLLPVLYKIFVANSHHASVAKQS